MRILRRQAVASLVAGLVTTIVIAWIISWLRPYEWCRTPAEWPHAIAGLSPRDAPHWHVSVITFTATTRVMRTIDFARFYANALADNITERLPYWSRARRHPQVAPTAGEAISFIEETVHGWPLPCLRYEVEYQVTRTASGEQEQLVAIRGGARTSSEPTTGSWRDDLQILPYAPIWRALAADMLLYAAVWWGLWQLCLVVHRTVRRVRGRCPGCGYQLRRQFDAGCSECGWNRRM